MNSSNAGSATIDIRICNERGLHARASAKFVRLAATFSADILVSKDGMEVCGTSIMGLMLLAAAQSENIQISADGPDASVAIAALSQLIEARFDEDK